ncbi:EIIBC-Tre [Serratia fonticola]|uniref:EIIBC-Tre n=1 Tax=Serratia fonticola TaxID=47917 RepID=A0A4U9TP50_SERFO|nr:EIIBC-Tre [Serratia fonticola]
MDAICGFIVHFVILTASWERSHLIKNGLVAKLKNINTSEPSLINKGAIMSKVQQQDIDRLIVLVGGAVRISPPSATALPACVSSLTIPPRPSRKRLSSCAWSKAVSPTPGSSRVVIGPEVGDYYQALIAATGINEADKEQAKLAARQNMTWFERGISHFAEIFFPLLASPDQRRFDPGFPQRDRRYPMSGGQTLAQMHPAWKTIYDFLWLLGEAIFMFLPVAICWSTVKKMGGTPVLGIVMGITLGLPAVDELLPTRPASARSVELWLVHH